jgi:hypothetical protein
MTCAYVSPVNPGLPVAVSVVVPGFFQLMRAEKLSLAAGTYKSANLSHMPEPLRRRMVRSMRARRWSLSCPQSRSRRKGGELLRHSSTCP